MTQTNCRQVTLTQEDAERRRVVYERLRRRGARHKQIPQAVLDRLLPRVRIERYVDEEGASLGECWLWTLSVGALEVPRARIGGRSVSVRRWVANQMRAQPVPATKWTVVADCEQGLCVNPTCIHAMPRTKAQAMWRARDLWPTEQIRVAVANAKRASSKLTPERVQRMRDERAASILAGKPITYAELGERYGISEGAAGHIIRGDRWNPGLATLVPRRVASVFDLGRLA